MLFIFISLWYNRYGDGMKNKLIDIPKIELHVHLDGSVDLDLVKDLVNFDKDELYKKMVVSDNCNSLTEYLEKFEIPCAFLQTKEAIINVSKLLLEKFRQDNVVYAEVRFAPLKHISNGLTPQEVIDAVLEGIKDINIKVNLILCMMRNDSFVDNLNVINIAKEYLNKGVCAIDLAGDEAGYSTEEFVDLFNEIKRLNIPFTIHAGEAAGAESIRSAIDFGAKRIGHGVRCIENPKLVKELKDRNIHLEVCPLSNVHTNVVNSLDKHPIKLLFDYGVNLGVNTDNRTVSNTSLVKEYEGLVREFDFNINDFIKMNLNALDASFLSEEEKEFIRFKYFN